MAIGVVDKAKATDDERDSGWWKKNKLVGLIKGKAI